MYAIVGATGNTGQVVAENLLGKGAKARVIGRDAKRLERFVPKGAEAVVADVEDAAALERAFVGVRAVYAIIPPNMTTEDFRGYQERASDALAAAIEKAKVPYVVSLSSVGAHRAERVGPVNGLHTFEQKLNRIPGLQVLHLRAGYFMENLFMSISVIKQFGLLGTPLRADLALPLIATRDIGRVAAEELLQLSFTGKQTRELLGQRDVTMAEATKIIGKAIGRENLSYMQVPYAMAEMAMRQMGLPAATVKLFIEMHTALNDGWMKPEELRSARNTTPTSIETFVGEEFAPRFQGQAAGA